MKKKETKKKQTGKKREISTEEREINSQLGSFGLEPPKLYRNDQHLTPRVSEEVRRKAQRRNEVNSKKTVQEQRQEQNKKRKKSRIKRKILEWTALSLAIVTVIIVLSLTVLFKIDNITIKGNQKYSVEEITAVLPISKDKNLFLADTKGAKQKLEETLPYIYNADIDRKFPSTIVVNITETKTIYSIKNKDKTYTLLDDNFKVLEEAAAKKPKKSLEIQKAAIKQAIAGKEAEFTDEKIKSNLSTLCDAIRRLQLDKITAVYSNDINNNYMVYDGRITFKLGNLDNLDDKIYSALSATEKLAENNPQVEGTMTVNGDKRVYFTEK